MTDLLAEIEQALAAGETLASCADAVHSCWCDWDGKNRRDELYLHDRTRDMNDAIEAYRASARAALASLRPTTEEGGV